MESLVFFGPWVVETLLKRSVMQEAQFLAETGMGSHNHNPSPFARFRGAPRNMAMQTKDIHFRLIYWYRDYACAVSIGTTLPSLRILVQ